MDFLNEIQWLKKEVNLVEQKGIAEFLMPRESLVFKGHFPDQPILAGAYQLEIIRSFMEEILKVRFRVIKTLKTKFTALIGPDERLTLSVFWKDSSTADEKKIDARLFKSDGASAMSTLMWVMEKK